MIAYPSVSGGKLINAVAKPAGSINRSAAIPAPKAPRPTKAPTYPGKPPMMPPELGPDTTPTYDVPSASGINYAPPPDPAIAKMLALAARTRDAANAEAAAKRKQATIEYGDATGVPGVDAATAQAAAANPFSIVAALQRDYNTGVGDLEEALNKANLFYGGYRGQQLGQAATDYQQQKYNASTRYQATLQDIQSALTQALLNADMMEIQAGGAGAGGGETYNQFGQVTNDPGSGVGRPGEWADLPVLKGYDPNRNSDAQYDLTYATPVGDGTFIGPNGQRYDDHGRVI